VIQIGVSFQKQKNKSRKLLEVSFGALVQCASNLL